MQQESGKLKLGKGGILLRQEPTETPSRTTKPERRTSGCWPKPMMQNETHYLDLVITKQGGSVLAEAKVEGRPSAKSRKVFWSSSASTGLCEVQVIKNIAESNRVAGLPRVEAHLCWRNAVNVIYEVPEYSQATYVEGIVLDPRNPHILQEHGWVERDGEIIDPTLPELELRYFPALKWVGMLDVVVMEGRHECLPFFRTPDYTFESVCRKMEEARRSAQEWAKAISGTRRRFQGRSRMRPGSGPAPS